MLAWALALVPLRAATAAAAVDLEIHRPVNYYDMVPPAAGQSYIDPVFGTAIRRISDARHQPDSADTGTLDFIVHEYSTMSPFNQDDSLVVLMHQSYFALYDGEGRYLRDLAIGPGGEPRWSRTDPNVLYARYGNALWSYDTRRDVWTLVHTFAEYTTITGRGESDICFDGDHFVLAHTRVDTFKDRERWILPLEGEVRSGHDVAGPGDCLLVEGGEAVMVDGRMLIGAMA